MGQGALQLQWSPGQVLQNPALFQLTPEGLPKASSSWVPRTAAGTPSSLPAPDNYLKYFRSSHGPPAILGSYTGDFLPKYQHDSG